MNEKIEGFFDVCHLSGLTGEQGVMIPATNVRHVILRPDVVEAIRDGQFHVWSIEHIDQVLELLSGQVAGEISHPDGIHGRVLARLKELAAALKRQHPLASSAERTRHVSTSSPSEDPRPPLPGQSQ